MKKKQVLLAVFAATMLTPTVAWAQYPQTVSYTHLDVYKRQDYNLLLVRPYYIPEEVNGIPIVPYGISNSQVSSSQNYSFSLLQNAGDYNRTETSNMNINAGLEYDFGWNKWLKGLKLKFSYSKSINSTKNNQYGSSYELYYMSKRCLLYTSRCV